ncbi:hypothetical protein ACSLBF_13640 [Pseudoalteromonas sp. T1lg65]|uniref:hypothetical protein n=1 Tax=Pseudoalteromonas sp. T1lg65 TaxID=2077101 RepID=UPI003F7A2D54
MYPVLLLFIFGCSCAHATPNYNELQTLTQKLENDFTSLQQVATLRSLTDIHVLYAPSQGVHLFAKFELDEQLDIPATFTNGKQQEPEFSTLMQKLKALSHELFQLEKKQTIMNNRGETAAVHEIKNKIRIATQQKLMLSNQYTLLSQRLDRRLLREQLMAHAIQSVADILCNARHFSLSLKENESIAFSIVTWPDNPKDPAVSQVWVFNQHAVRKCQLNHITADSLIKQAKSS